MSRRQSRLVLGAAAAVLLALLATFAFALANSQSKADNDVKQRFRERAQVSAALTQALFATVSAESGPQNAKLYGGASVSPAALAKQQAQSGGRGRFPAVLAARGRVLARSPQAPSNPSPLLGPTRPRPPPGAGGADVRGRPARRARPPARRVVRRRPLLRLGAGQGLDLARRADGADVEAVRVRQWHAQVGPVGTVHRLRVRRGRRDRD